MPIASSEARSSLANHEDRPLHVILPADVFPPGKVGGAAWSSLALAQALEQRGHRVTVIVPRHGQHGNRWQSVGALRVLEVGYRAPRIPFVLNYFRFERLWPRLVAAIETVAQAAPDQPTVIHAQHSQTGPAAVLAGQRLKLPSIVTIRDHWPWDYFATGLHGDRVPYPRNTWASLATDLVARQGPWRGSVALPAIPYMLGHVRRRAQLLSQANAVIAVSRYIATRLASIVPPERLHVLPNIVDSETLKATVATSSALEPAEPFLLFVGKLERNKGAHLLPMMLQQQPAAPLLLIAGDGSLRAELAAALTAAGVRFQLLPGWTAHDDVLRLMQRAEVVLFPSGWGEPLSRVLLEASAVGSCILALDTGGTADAIRDNFSGVLVPQVDALPAALTALLADPKRRQRLRAGARQRALSQFSPTVVAAKVETLYRNELQVERENRKDAKN